VPQLASAFVLAMVIGGVRLSGLSLVANALVLAYLALVTFGVTGFASRISAAHRPAPVPVRGAGANH
jgi:hypothetical protein